MKPAKDWVKEAGSREEFYGGRYHEDNILDLGVVEEIQLDAMREGMRRAAKMVMEAKWQKGSMNFNQGFISGNISVAADSLTEKDL